MASIFFLFGLNQIMVSDRCQNHDVVASSLYGSSTSMRRTIVTFLSGKSWQPKNGVKLTGVWQEIYKIVKIWEFFYSAFERVRLSSSQLDSKCF